MGIGDRIGRSWRIAALLGVGAAGGAAAVAVATVPDSNGVIHACVATDPASGLPTTGANVRIIDPSRGQQCTTTMAVGGPTSTVEATLNWNITGPQGPPGQNGANGQNGQPGTQGPPGADGKTATVTARGLTLLPPTFSGTSFGTLTLGAGSSSITAEIGGMSIGPHTLGTGAGTGKTGLHDIEVTRHVDKLSAKLQLACAGGQHFKEGTIVLRKAGGKQIEYDMHDVIIATYSAGSAKNAQPTEDLTLDFAKVDIHVKK